MTDAIDQLFAAHRNIGRVLQVLQAEIDRYGVDRGDRPPDLPLILEVLDYLENYPQVFHHPLEEQAFRLMIERGAGDAEVIEHLHAQHHELSTATTELMRLFTAVARDYPVAIDEIKTRLQDYVDLQYRHMHTEEEKVFPDMATALDDADWHRIVIALTARQDPLFGRDTRHGFSELIKRLDRADR